MNDIADDVKFREAIGGLDPRRQRVLTARFVENVFALSGDPGLKRALDTAHDIGAGDDELTVAMKAARRPISWPEPPWRH